MNEKELIEFLKENLIIEITPISRRSVEVSLFINTSYAMGENLNYELIDSDMISLGENGFE